MFFRSETIGWGSTYASDDFKGILKHLMPSQFFHNEAHAIIEEMCAKFWEKFQGEKTPEKICKFIGIHVRRGDFLVTHKEDSLKDVSVLAEKIAKFSNMYNINMVFMATDASPDDPISPKKIQQFFYEKKSPISVYSLNDLFQYDTKIFKFTELDIALIEQTVLVLGAIFVGTEKSMYSICAQEMRDAIHPQLITHFFS